MYGARSGAARPPRPPLPPMKPPMGFYSVVKAVESTLWSFRPSRGSSSYTVEMGVPPIRAHARGRPRRVSQTIRSAPRSEAHCLRVSTKPLNSRHAGVVSRPRSNAGTAAWAPASKPPRARRCGRHLGPAFPPTISLRRPARIPGVSRHDDAGAARSVAAFPVSVTPSHPASRFSADACHLAGLQSTLRPKRALVYALPILRMAPPDGAGSETGR
jgi:hypothetical protein